ncbi:hypothetical protein [Zooshikella ganghwensis]|uniref:Uncharacterized protein n=1 Tax=Zooshikella ganghwensis TaxID=202772 RepID=A0A4P9VKB6_9GAMM|nr:hypothetical protein [Zooshikella ganghwensis]RDH42590.1 hypothetical protein B9G39_03525 [Zooshikella ganghwensis]
MQAHAPIDSEGRDLQVGDWVRVIAAPLSIRGMPEESLEAFSKAVGHTFQIEEFDEIGCLHLDMYPKISSDSIYIEPYCVSRFRRYKKLSNAFLKKQAVLNFAQEPVFEMRFEIIAHYNVDLESLGLYIISEGTTEDTMGGFACWPKERKILGSVKIDAEDPNAISILKRIKEMLENCSEIEEVTVSGIQLIGKP